MNALRLCLLLVAHLGAGAGAATGAADEVRGERAQVHERRLAQETTLALLKDQRVGVGEVLGLYGNLARASAIRAKRLESDLRILRRRVELGELEAGVAQEVLDGSLARLGPRLLELYRLNHGGELGVLLSARDFAALRWRAHAFRTVLKSDLAALEQTRRVAEFQTRSLTKLDALKVSFLERRDEALEAAEAARSERTELIEALTLVQAEASQSDRVLRDLKSTESQLGRVLEQLTERTPSRGFGALKGKLSLPARGLIERGFGNVVNARFNTVTLHKGLDIRAPAGQPVRSVAAGRVVYAGWLKGYGNLLIVEHEDAFHTVFAHLISLDHRAGDAVDAGEVLGRVGDSGSSKGPHLYFELRQRGVAVDPAPWLKADED